MSQRRLHPSEGIARNRSGVPHHWPRRAVRHYDFGPGRGLRQESSPQAVDHRHAGWRARVVAKGPQGHRLRRQRFATG